MVQQDNTKGTIKACTEIKFTSDAYRKPVLKSIIRAQSQVFCHATHVLESLDPNSMAEQAANKLARSKFKAGY